MIDTRLAPPANAFCRGIKSSPRPAINWLSWRCILISSPSQVHHTEFAASGQRSSERSNNGSGSDWVKVVSSVPAWRYRWRNSVVVLYTWSRRFSVAQADSWWERGWLSREDYDVVLSCQVVFYLALYARSIQFANTSRTFHIGLLKNGTQI